MRLKLFYGGKAKFEIESIPKGKDSDSDPHSVSAARDGKKRERKEVCREECTGF